MDFAMQRRRVAFSELKYIAFLRCSRPHKKIQMHRVKDIEVSCKRIELFCCRYQIFHVCLPHVTGILVLGLISFHHDFPRDTEFCYNLLAPFFKKIHTTKYDVKVPLVMLLAA
jgi:hypothetical protein